MALQLEKASAIVGVTVYEQGALVHRAAPCGKVLAGDVTVVLWDLPRSMDRDSLQVSLRGGADGCSLSGVAFDDHGSLERDDPAHAALTAADDDSAVQAKKKAAAERVAAIDARLEAIEDERQIAQAQRDVAKKAYDMRCRMFDHATSPDEGKHAPLAEVDAWAAMLDERGAAEADELAARRAHAAAAETLNRERDELQAERRNVRGQASDDTASKKGSRFLVKVHLKVVAESIEGLELLLSFMTKEAGWDATYDLRLHSVKGTAELHYNALVRQTGAEPWDNVHLTLSTAKPQVSGRMPDLKPWHASLRQKVALKSAGAPGGGIFSGRRSRSSMRGGYDVNGDGLEGVDIEEDALCEEEQASPIRVEEATVSDAGSGTSVSFELPKPQSVPSSGDPVRVTLTSIALTPEMRHTIRPRLNEVAFAVMRATNASRFTLLTGATNVFVDNNFVTKTALPRVTPKESFKCAVGTDEAVVVKYKTIKSQKSESGGYLTTKKQHLAYQRVITVKNNKAVPIHCSIEDQVPVSHDGSIEVKLEKPTVAADAAEQEKQGLRKTEEGYLLWRRDVPAGQDLQLDLHFTVTHHHGDSIRGL